jgi:hypothetical protein
MVTRLLKWEPAAQEEGRELGKFADLLAESFAEGRDPLFYQTWARDIAASASAEADAATEATTGDESTMRVWHRYNNSTGNPNRIAMDDKFTGVEDFVLHLPRTMALDADPIVALCQIIDRLEVHDCGHAIELYQFEPSILAFHCQLGLASVAYESDEPVFAALESHTLPELATAILQFTCKRIRFRLPLLQRYLPYKLAADFSYFCIAIRWVDQDSTAPLVEVEQRNSMAIRSGTAVRRRWQWMNCLGRITKWRIGLCLGGCIDELHISLPSSYRPTEFKVIIKTHEYMKWTDVAKMQTATCADRTCYRLNLRLPPDDRLKSSLDTGEPYQNDHSEPRFVPTSAWTGDIVLEIVRAIDQEQADTSVHALIAVSTYSIVKDCFGEHMLYS